MKRIGLLLCALALAVGGLTVIAGPATAAPNCQHSAGPGAVRSAAHLDPVAGGSPVGAVQLCKDGSSRYWGYAVLYSPLPASRWANAYLERYLDGHFERRVSCHSSGGNDYITRNQTMCWTPKLDGANSRYTFYVYGMACHGAFENTSNCYATGHTKFTFR